jgi:outer membrane protein assembly factor BamD (BamD/ComL family)
MRHAKLAALLMLLCAGTAAQETWRLKDGQKWESVAANPSQQYALKIAELKDRVRSGDSEAVADALAQLKAEFPQYIGPDLDLFVEGELQYWQDHYTKAMKQYEKLLKDYPGSEFAPAVLQRQFDIAQAYLGGRKKTVLGVIRIRGYAEGVEMMERISDRAGLDDPNSVGLKAAVAVAEYYESREKYIEAYLKWSEIASYWETGPIGKRALLRMAEDNFLAYHQPRPERRPLLDASKLVTAKTYYEKYAALYPGEAKQHDIPNKIKQIDEHMAYKQFTIGQYYRRVGKTEAADFYFDMVVQNWPQTEAAALAKQALEENTSGNQARGK